MHYSKIYDQLLRDLPPDLRDSAIEYRQLKKLINQVVAELSSHGLGPEVLQGLLDPSSTAKPKPVFRSGDDGKLKNGASSSSSSSAGPTLREVSDFMKTASDQKLPIKVVYEFAVEPRLRVSAEEPPRTPRSLSPSSLVGSSSRELVIPLASDSAFFHTLTSALHALSAHLGTIQSDFRASLSALARTVSGAARPVSEASSSSFVPYSRSEHPSAVSVPADVGAHAQLLRRWHLVPGAGARSDLYAWREIFQTYVETEVFESTHERSRGEHTAKEAEKRLRLFEQRLKQSGADKKLLLKESRAALATFMQMNEMIIDLKKFQEANLEALRKILKKHAKRTALPLPLPAPAPTSSSLSVSPSATPTNSAASSPDTSVIDLVTPAAALAQTSPTQTPYSIISLFPTTASTLPHMLVQAVGSELIPIVPQIDDYACLICTSIAFKPIRLGCGHLFCVRCLVKMQKRGQGDCPMCRAPTVLVADKSNVDWALLNFMKDWFPIEARAKLKQNEREATEEQLQELGIDPNAQGCTVM